MLMFLLNKYCYKNGKQGKDINCVTPFVSQIEGGHAFAFEDVSHYREQKNAGFKRKNSVW